MLTIFQCDILYFIISNILPRYGCMINQNTIKMKYYNIRPVVGQSTRENSQRFCRQSNFIADICPLWCVKWYSEFVTLNSVNFTPLGIIFGTFCTIYTCNLQRSFFNWKRAFYIRQYSRRKSTYTSEIFSSAIWRQILTFSTIENQFYSSIKLKKV